MVRVLTRQGVRFRENRSGWQKISCPSAFHVHGDRNPSASVSLELGKYECHACPLRGDGFDLMRALEDMDARAVLAALDLTGDGVSARVESDWIL